jgi:NTE family protein
MAPTVGLVLGGGGLVGQAFHAGALAALEHDTGWDPRTAEVIVGTSAGAVTGALLRADIGAGDLAGCFLDAPWSPAATLGIALPSLMPMRWQAALRPQLPRLDLVTRCARLPWFRSPVSSLLALVPDGEIDLVPHLGFLRELTGDEWPAAPLLVTATRQRDGRLVVFGDAEAPDMPLVAAVAASCAVPSYFRPVVHDGTAYLDGGLHSATNADILRDRRFDVIVVVSPLSTAAPLSWSLDGVARRFSSRRLRCEVGMLEAAGHDVVLVEPDVEAVAAMGHDLMSSRACAATVREAFLGLGRDAMSVVPKLQDVLGPRSKAA